MGMGKHQSSRSHLKSILKTLVTTSPEPPTETPTKSSQERKYVFDKSVDSYQMKTSYHLTGEVIKFTEIQKTPNYYTAKLSKWKNGKIEKQSYSGKTLDYTPIFRYNYQQFKALPEK